MKEKEVEITEVDLYKRQIKLLNFEWFMTSNRKEKNILHDEIMKYQKMLIELEKVRVG